MREMGFLSRKLTAKLHHFSFRESTTWNWDTVRSLFQTSTYHRWKQCPEPQVAVGVRYSPQSVASETDINAYAEAKVLRMEAERRLSKEGHTTAETGEELMSTGNTESQQDHLSTVPRGASTPMDEERATSTSLTALESALRIATASDSQLPELLPTLGEDHGDIVTIIPQSEDDNESSINEKPALPNNEPKVWFLADLSEGEETVEEASNAGSLSLYGIIPSATESGAEGEHETGSNALSQRDT